MTFFITIYFICIAVLLIPNVFLDLLSFCYVLLCVHLPLSLLLWIYISVDLCLQQTTLSLIFCCTYYLFLCLAPLISFYNSFYTSQSPKRLDGFWGGVWGLICIELPCFSIFWPKPGPTTKRQQKQLAVSRKIIVTQTHRALRRL